MLCTASRSQAPLERVHSIPGNQTTCTLMYVSTFGENFLGRDGFVNFQEIIPVVDAANRIALDRDMPVVYTWGLQLTLKYNVAFINPVLCWVVYTWGLQLTLKYNIAFVNPVLCWVVYTWGLQLTLKYNIAFINPVLCWVVYTWGLQLTLKYIAFIILCSVG